MGTRGFILFVALFSFASIINVSEGKPSDLVEKPDNTYTLWYDKFCKESEDVNSFWVGDIGYVECNDDSCGLDFTNGTNKYKVDYCFVCCYGKITS